MILSTVETTQPKGWLVGPWNSPVPIPVGYANEGINELHYHAEMYEIYLIAKGESTALVNEQEVHLRAGHMLVVEPHEVHTFIHSSPDYLHFVLQVPYVANDKHSVTSKRSIEEIFAPFQGKAIFYEDPNTPTTDEWSEV